MPRTSRRYNIEFSQKTRHKSQDVFLSFFLRQKDEAKRKEILGFQALLPQLLKLIKRGANSASFYCQNASFCLLLGC